MDYWYCSWYGVVGIPAEALVNMYWISVDCSLDEMNFVGVILNHQGWDAAICARGFHGKFPVLINWNQIAEEGVYLVLLYYTDDIIHRGMAHSTPNASSSKYSTYVLTVTRNTGACHCSPLQLLVEFCSKEKTWLFRPNSKSEMILSIGEKLFYSKKCSVPFSSMFSMSFLLITSRATGTGMLVNKTLNIKRYKSISWCYLLFLKVLC